MRGRQARPEKGCDITRQPRLSIGLPVYNGADYLAPSLDALLGQTFEDFEIVVSSNASTDDTDEIVRQYAARDPRIRLVRQPENIGAARNHDVVFRHSRGELFKWASADDLYARDLLERCVAILDEEPDVVLAHSWTAAIDDQGELIQAMEYPLATDSPHVAERLRSMLFGGDDVPGAIRADDFYGVIRSDVLRTVKPHGSHHHADQTFMADLALRGPFRQVPDWLYFRRHHGQRAFLANPTVHAWTANLDPSRANRWRTPKARLYAEFVWAHVDNIRRAPLTAAERRECFRVLGSWIADRTRRRLPGDPGAPDGARNTISPRASGVHAVVPGQQAT